MELRRDSRQGIALYRHNDVPAKTSPSTSQIEHVEEIQSMIQVRKRKLTVHELQKSERLFNRKLEALQLRRNSTRGTTPGRSEDVTTHVSPFTHRVDKLARMSSAPLSKSN